MSIPTTSELQEKAKLGIAAAFTGTGPAELTPTQRIAFQGVQSAFAPVTTSSTPLIKDEKKLVDDITTASAPEYTGSASDIAYTNDLRQQQIDLKAQLVQEEANINANFANLKTSAEGRQKGEVGSTSAGLARAGGYLGVSGSGTGVLLNLAQSHSAEMSALESKRLSALGDARAAASDKNYKVARDMYAVAKDIEKEASSRKKDYFKKIQDAADDAAEKEVEVDIYNAVVGGDRDALSIFNTTKGRASIDKISNFLTKTSPKKADGTNAYTNEQMMSLLGTEIKAEQIKASQDYINENGYTDEFRASLTARQRFAFDAIYRPTPKGEKAVTGDTAITSEDKRILTGAGFIQSEIGDIPRAVADFGIDAVLKNITDPRKRAAIQKIYSITPKVTRAQIQTATTLKVAQDGLEATYTDDELFELAQEHGHASFFTGKDTDIKRFLESDKAKELYVDILLKQYTDAGLVE